MKGMWDMHEFSSEATEKHGPHWALSCCPCQRESDYIWQIDDLCLLEVAVCDQLGNGSVYSFPVGKTDSNKHFEISSFRLSRASYLMTSSLIFASISLKAKATYCESGLSSFWTSQRWRKKGLKHETLKQTVGLPLSLHPLWLGPKTNLFFFSLELGWLFESSQLFKGIDQLSQENRGASGRPYTAGYV